MQYELSVTPARLLPTCCKRSQSRAFKNPMLATCAAGAAGVVMVAAPAIVSMPLLSTVGFGVEGVKACE